jgi:hypothetical protein
MQSKAKTVQAYLAELPADRRAQIEAVRKVVLANMDPVLEEGMMYGMICWYIPHMIFPPGYHVDPKLPLGFAALASQKNQMSLYVMFGYADGIADEAWFRTEWARTGKKLDMGKSCIRFKRVEDLALDVLARAFRRVSVKDYLASYAKVDPRNRPKAAVVRRPKANAAGTTARPAKPRGTPRGPAAKARRRAE